MSEEHDFIGEVANQSNNVIDKAYDDLVHPTAKSIGNTLSLLPRTIGIWFSGWEKWIINGEESIRLTAKAVKEKAEKISEEKLTRPELYVAVPAIQQLSYCYDSMELRELYANLLVSSMNIDTKNSVHPSFVYIIKQLTPDEAKLLKIISEGKGVFPLIDLHINAPENNGYNIKIRYFSNISEGVCDYPELISSYIDNFVRLGIIEILPFENLTNEALYTPLENHPKIRKIMEEPLSEGYYYETIRRVFRVTALGWNFIKTCVSTETDNSKNG